MIRHRDLWLINQHLSGCHCKWPLSGVMYVNGTIVVGLWMCCVCRLVRCDSRASFETAVYSLMIDEDIGGFGKFILRCTMRSALLFNCTDIYYFMIYCVVGVLVFFTLYSSCCAFLFLILVFLDFVSYLVHCNILKNNWEGDEDRRIISTSACNFLLFKFVI